MPTADPHGEVEAHYEVGVVRDAASDLADALREIVRLRTATDEGSLQVRADRMYEIARTALGDPVPGSKPTSI